MAGSSSSSINTIVDSVITSLSSATTIGPITGVYERDEHPAIPANEGKLPIAYVVPLIEGKDTVNTTIDDDSLYHSFPISIVAYYSMPDVATSLRTVRNYGYEALDLFKAKQSLPIGQITSAIVEVGYWTAPGGQVIHYWIVNLSIKALF